MKPGNAPAQATKRPYRTEAQWRQLINDFDSSDLSASEYCIQHRLKYTTFHQWRKRLQSSPDNSPTSPALIELTGFTKTSSEKSSNWDIELDLGSGIFLRIRRA